MRSGTIGSSESLHARIAVLRRGGNDKEVAPERLARFSGHSEPGAGTNRHAVVIGSGFGGLAAAVRLGAMGYRVTVVERLAEPGGRAGVWRQNGFTFDTGPTIVTAPQLFEELWRLAGRDLRQEVDLRALDPYYTIRFDDGETFEYSGNLQRMRAEVARLSPSDAAGFERFLALARRICSVGFEQLGHQPFNNWRDMLRVLPALVRLQSYRSVYGLVSRYLRDPRLRIVFSFHPLLVGGNPFSTTAVYSLITDLERRWGVHYPMGGTGRLVEGLVSIVRQFGGTFLFNREVAEVVVCDKSATGVRLQGGEVIAADVVVSNADADWTYRKLVPAVYRKRWTDRRLDRSRSSMSLFVWYFGTDKQFPEVPHHSILLGPRYRGLVDDIFNRKRLSDDCSLYLHRPTATDSSLAPRGCDTFYVLSPVPNLDGDTDWSSVAETYRDRILQRLQETVLPGLAPRIVASKLMTPLDFRDRLLSSRGAAFAHEPVLTQSAWFRPHNRSEDIRNLYLVGAGTHPGAGLPGVLSSAKVLERLLQNA